jgi:hypothetical protein
MYGSHKTVLTVINFIIYRFNTFHINLLNNLTKTKTKNLYSQINHTLQLPIETGRWNGIDRENRQCLKCNSRSILWNVTKNLYSQINHTLQ